MPVTASLQLPGDPHVYVIGDMAYLQQRGKPLPMVAPAAIQQGQTVAENILRDLQGLPPKRFVYRDKGTLATIGRNSAVARSARSDCTAPSPGSPGWWST